MLDKLLRFVYLSLPWIAIIGSIIATAVLVLTGLGWWSIIMLVGVIAGVGMIIDDYHIGMR